jgi:HTH-type transcriptional repressor of NAD biosynthesis genes
MTRGFVLGKFLPLHKGHLALIDFARKKCDFLYILICFTKGEEIDGIVRKQWLYEELGQQDDVSFISFPYDENILPNTSVSSRTVSEKWAIELKKILPDANIVFTSERYGDYLAEFMGIKHQKFDEERIGVPVSGTDIRKNLFENWNYMADSAKPWFVKKIVLLGSESTGKSTLTARLADYFNTAFVPEVAREIVEKTNECTSEDLKAIAIGHAQKIAASIPHANKLLFIDTDINITKSYSLFLFNKALLTNKWVEQINQADLYFFLETDSPFVQDGTRINEEQREKLSQSHKDELKKNNINFITLNGDWEHRFQTAIKIINDSFF